jgi:PXPV repeat-containing protein
MKKLLVLALAAVILAPTMAFAGPATDAALGLGAFAVFNQILGGVGVFGAPVRAFAAPAPVYVAPAPVYVAPPPVYVTPAPVYVAPPPVVVSRPVIVRERVFVRRAPVFFPHHGPVVVHQHPW